VRSAQRRRQLSAGAALPSAARAVPEGCCRLVWRRAGPGKSHAHESSQPDEPDQSHESYQPDQCYQPDEHDEPDDYYQSDDYDDYDQSGRYPVTRSSRFTDRRYFVTMHR
jgi:hypothetical protein